MKKTLSNARKNTKNLIKNVTAGMFLSTTVAATDLVENLTTSITRPTENILKTIENTSDDLGNTLKNTTKGNTFHTAGNIITTPFRVAGTVAEGAVKSVGHGLQFFSGINQTIGNAHITTGESRNQLFSTSDQSPDIPHKEIHLKEATDLELNGEHLLFGKDHKASSSKVLRRLGNVKNSVVNIPMNALRIGTDLISATAQRVRGVRESVEGVPKDIKSSRSGVFTKGQSFGTKFKKVFTHGLPGFVKSVGKGVLNIANEGVLKSGAAVIGTAGNFLGRLRGNTLKPLFSTKPAEEQSDNALEKTSRFKKLQSYYTSTPRKKGEKKEEAKKEEKSEEKGEQQQEEAKAEEAKEETSEQKGEEATAKKEIVVIPKETKAEKKEEAKTMSPAPANDTPVAPQKEEKKETNKKEGEEAKNEKESAAPKKEEDEKDAKKENLLSTLDPLTMKKEYGKALNKEQKYFEKKDWKEHNLNGEHNEKYTAFVDGLNKYIKAGGRVVFTGMDANSGPVKSINITDDKVKVTYTPSPSKVTKEEEAKLIESGEEKTDEISFKEIFCPDFSFHCKELTDKKEKDTKEKESTEKKEERKKE